MKQTGMLDRLAPTRTFLEHTGRMVISTEVFGERGSMKSQTPAAYRHLFRPKVGPALFAYGLRSLDSHCTAIYSARLVLRAIYHTLPLTGFRSAYLMQSLASLGRNQTAVTLKPRTFHLRGSPQATPLACRPLARLPRVAESACTRRPPDNTRAQL